MDWLNRIVSNSNKKKPVLKRKNSLKNIEDKRYHLKSNGRVVGVHKNTNGTGYVYRKRTPSGVKNIRITRNIFKTEGEAKNKIIKTSK